MYIVLYRAHAEKLKNYLILLNSKTVKFIILCNLEIKYNLSDPHVSSLLMFVENKS